MGLRRVAQWGMLDSHIRPIIDPPLNLAAKFLYDRGVTGNMVTFIGLGFGVLCFISLVFQWYGAAMAFVVLNRLMDGLDGAVARHSVPTDIGGYLDIVVDFIFYSGTVFFFAVGRPEDSLSAAFLIFSFMGTGASFLAYAIIAAKRGVETEHQGKKSFYYLSGLTEGTETIMVLLLICLFPSWFSWIAVGFGILCWLTTFARVKTTMDDFS